MRLTKSIDSLGDRHHLTPAERAVARLAVEGLSNKEIGHKLGSSVSTVRTQLVSIYRKVGVSGRTELSHRVFQVLEADTDAATPTPRREAPSLDAASAALARLRDSRAVLEELVVEIRKSRDALAEARRELTDDVAEHRRLTEQLVERVFSGAER